MKVSELTSNDNGRILTEGLWLELLADGSWTLNDANTAVAISADEDIDELRDQWLAAVGE